jgi:hypothetical protein
MKRKGKPRARGEGEGRKFLKKRVETTHPSESKKFKRRRQQEILKE